MNGRHCKRTAAATLQQIMLRGAFTNIEWLVSLLGVGVMLAALAWLLLRPTMARQ